MSESETSDFTHHAGWEGRFSAIENNHLQLQRDLSAITKEVATAVQATENLIHSVRSISENQTINTRTNWGVVLTGLVVFVMLMGLVVYEPMDKLEQIVADHLQGGHPKSVTDKIFFNSGEIERNEKLISNNREKLDALSLKQHGSSERILGIERELYPGATYRSGRPTGSRSDIILREPKVDRE